jgi:RimJ/RimL family protein N-acetyltransferase
MSRTTARAAWTAAALLALAAAPSAGAQTLDDQTRAEAVATIGTLMTERYVFPDKGAACAARLDEALAAGELDASTNEAFALLLTETLQGVTHDLHLRVRPQAPPPPEPTPEELEAWEQRQWARGRAQNFGFENVLRLPDNVGVLDLRSFQPPEHARDTAMAAMAFLGNADALIVDLRQNGGGSPEMVQLLCTYLFDEPTHLNSLYWRETDETQEFWTLSTDELPGPRLPDVPVFLLTSRNTFSGAEEFAYNLRCLERATLIGETTGGGAHPGGSFPVNDQLGIFISLGRAINPITGTNWEGTGVAPHIECKANDAMGKAVELARKAARERQDAQALGS